MKTENENFSAKVLLFGEYTVLFQAKALAVPFGRFCGKFSFESDNKIAQNQSNQFLFEFLKYIQLNQNKLNLSQDFNLLQFETDLQNGLFFDSNIPIGYGIGSSGAVTAAIYHRYVRSRTSFRFENVLEVKNDLAALESFFHNVSSGIDPFVSYCNRPVIFQSENVEPLLPVAKNDVSIYLIDTNVKRTSKHLVSLFVDDCKTENYKHQIQNEYIPINNKCIELFQNNQIDNFFEQLQQLSKLQLTLFSKMIVPELIPLWKEGLESGKFYLKLCGAGGGGYVLLFAKNEDVIHSISPQFKSQSLQI